MSYTRILLHAVWATKDRKKYLIKENKNLLCNHIHEYCKTKDIHLININGFENHLHCLISMSSGQNIATIMNLIKGESSFWANKNLILNEKFGWQDDYFAVSVSQSHVNIVNDYINSQEEHHRKKTFQEEYDEFIKNYHFEE
ncbi:MAG: IS200/IS605 family transposase [Bacteroidetes bacterium]|nr:IS200/IS605 family transposase [Bacteroidota bacterium]